MINLIPFSKNDGELLSSWILSADAMCQWTGDVLQYPLNESQIKKYLGKINNQTSYAFTAFSNGTNDAIGHIALDYINLIHKHGSIIRIIVNPKFRRQGYGREMLLSMIDFAFNKLKLNRIELKVFTFNHPAIKLYLNIGFQTEGVLRKIFLYNNKYYDLTIMSLLGEEWLDNPLKSTRT